MSAAAGPSAAGPSAAGPLDLVLFDLDGTVTDSQAGIVGAYHHTLDILEMHVDEAAIRRCIGPPLEVALTSLGVPFERLVEAVAIFRTWFVVHGIFDNHLYVGITEVLQRLSRAGIPLGLATAKPRQQAVDILDHFALNSFFDPICGATLDGRLTHKDEIVADALVSVGLVGSPRVVMVGDREHDIYGAIANGVVAVGVTWGYGTRAELEGAGAHWIVDDPAELADLIVCLGEAT